MYQAFSIEETNRDENDLAPDDHHYIRGKGTLCVWQGFWRTITLTVLDIPAVSTESQVLNSFSLIYYKSEDGYPNFFFIFLSSFDNIVNEFYIYHLAEKIFCSILFSKFLTRDYILFFEPSSLIVDSGTVWLDTYIKIIVNCRDINQTLRKF